MIIVYQNGPAVNAFNRLSRFLMPLFHQRDRLRCAS
jgi:hypothetical protein